MMPDAGNGESLWICGYHPVRELLRHRPQEARRVLISTRRGGRRRGEIQDLCRRHRVSWAPAAERELRQLSGGAAHNGFAAEIRRQETSPPPAADLQLRVLLEDVQDPRNLGAILRVCEAAGVGEVLVRDRGSAPLSPSAVKASAGATEWLRIERVTNSARVIQDSQKEGFWVYGADASGQLPWDLDLTGPLLLCLGGEAEGLRARTKKLCDGLIGLPMRGRVASLNVATAASGLLYEAVRQRTVRRSREETEKGLESESGNR